MITESYRRVGGMGQNHRSDPNANTAPATCATTNPATSSGRIPANVCVIARAMVTAGFANEVLAVNQ